MFVNKVKGAVAVLFVCLAIGTTAAVTFRAAAGDQKGSQQAVAINQPTPGPVEKPADPPAPAVPVAVQPGGQFVPYESTVLESVAFSPDSGLLVGGGQGKAVLTWDLQKSQPGQVFKDLKGIVRRVALSPDGKTIAAGIDGGTILIWNVKSGKVEAELQADLPSKPDAIGINGVVNNFVFLPGGKLAALYTYLRKNGTENTQGEQLLIWDIKTRVPLVLHEESPGTAVDLAASPDGKFLAVSKYVDGFEVWDLETRKVVWHEKLDKNDFMSRVVFAPNGETLAVGGGKEIVGGAGIGAEGKLWLFDVKTKKLLHCVGSELMTGAYNAVAFTADSRGVITGSSSGKTVKYRTQSGRGATKVVSEMRRWDVANGKEVWRAEGELGWFTSIAASADGKLIAASDGKRLMLFDPEKGKRQTELMMFPNPLD
jgi:WD40 repeat protein